MWKTILRRVVIMIPQIVILSLLVFILAKFMPGDPFTGSITPQTDASQLHALKVQAGLYDPWYTQYVHWVVNMFHGDFGTSYQFKEPVMAVIGGRAVNTLWLSLFTVILTYLIAIPLGLLAGRYEDTNLDRGIMFFNYVTYAIPLFVFLVLGLWLFGYVLGWFPSGGSISLSANGFFGNALSRLYHMILPGVLTALLSTTGTVQYLRSEIVDQKHQDMVATARAKGVPERKVFSRHILRNSLLPIAAFMGYSITGLLGGSVFVEQIFVYPGMGQLFLNSISNRDFSVITALVMIYGILALFGTLLSDIIMSIVDPRIRIK
ncbi:oligopeptide ABC transporter permease [Pediococcus parvulus]|jgi:peptide/nickel transport system permease protein|uniref:oligopeptide ABC transporter permease n=1 Tax=Pediococcus parvulus TaxID=54062 RepID=UPI003757D534